MRFQNAVRLCLMYVEGNKTRQLFRDPARPTDAEKLASICRTHAMTYLKLRPAIGAFLWLVGATRAWRYLPLPGNWRCDAIWCRYVL
jgi:hypothetical protein